MIIEYGPEPSASLTFDVPGENRSTRIPIDINDMRKHGVQIKVKGKGAQAVYYGGEYPAAAPLSQQLKESGADVPLMGGDGMKSDEFPKLNKKAEGDLGTSVGAPVEELPSAKKFIAEYNKNYKENMETYGGGTYDATWAIIEAVKLAVQDNDGELPDDAREKVLASMSKVKFDGVTGSVSFDEYGDTTNTPYSASAVSAAMRGPPCTCTTRCLLR